MKILLVYNPHAAHGRARAQLPAVLSSFTQAGINADLRLTERPGHATQIVEEARLEDYDGVVAAGGDGALFEVLNGYYLNQSTRRAPLGVLPIGTGNAFARDIDLDGSRWQEGVACIAGGRTRKAESRSCR